MGCDKGNMSVEILNFIKKRRKTLTKNTKSGYHYKGDLHITIQFVEEMEKWQVALHHIGGDVVMTLDEFWIDENWQPVEFNTDRPPTMWYFHDYIDKVVREMTTFYKNEPLTFS